MVNARDDQSKSHEPEIDKKKEDNKQIIRH